MAGCGYVCPLCEGKGMDDNGDPCVYCSQDNKDWIDKVHGECPCSDIGKNENQEENTEQ